MLVARRLKISNCWLFTDIGRLSVTDSPCGHCSVNNSPYSPMTCIFITHLFDRFVVISALCAKQHIKQVRFALVCLSPSVSNWTARLWSAVFLAIHGVIQSVFMSIHGWILSLHVCCFKSHYIHGDDANSAPRPVWVNCTLGRTFTYWHQIQYSFTAILSSKLLNL